MLTVEILNKYFDRRKEELALCLKALENKDFSYIEQVGHKMKGNGITFGFPELSDLGSALETQARGKREPEVRVLVDRFQQWVARTEGTLNEPREIIDFSE